MAGILMFPALFALIFLGFPVAFALIGVAFGFGMYAFGDAVFFQFIQKIEDVASNFVLAAVPLFVFMGSMLERSGIAEQLFSAVHLWTRRLPGGLAIGTIIMCIIFAASTGVIGATETVVGLLAIPAMMRHKYSNSLISGTICAGGSLGSMILPSIVLIFYGLTANAAIGDLFLAVIIPGLLLAGFYMVYILVRCWINPALGPVPPDEELDIPLSEKLSLLKGLILPMGVALGVLGSIYAGIAAVGEAAAVGVAGTVLAAWVRGELKWKMMRDSLHQTMAACGLLLWLTFGATALIGVYNLLGGITYVRGLMTGLPFEPIVVVGLMMGVLIILGLFMDWVGVLLLTMPIFVPIIKTFDYDPIWFGILFCMNMQISYLSPPFGPAAFYLKGVAPPEISLYDIYRALWPFILMQIAAMLLVMFFPSLALWLPRTVGAG